MLPFITISSFKAHRTRCKPLEAWLIREVLWLCVGCYFCCCCCCCRSATEAYPNKSHSHLESRTAHSRNREATVLIVFTRKTVGAKIQIVFGCRNHWIYPVFKKGGRTLFYNYRCAMKPFLANMLGSYQTRKYNNRSDLYSVHREGYCKNRWNTKTTPTICLYTSKKAWDSIRQRWSRRQFIRDSSLSFDSVTP